MGGKRPDQYRIDPGEAGSTDYKNLRQDPGIKEQEKQKLHKTDKDEPLIPTGGENAEKARVRQEHDARKE